VIAKESELSLADGARVKVRSPRRGDAAALLDFIRALSHESWRNLGQPAAYFDAMTEEQEASFVEDLAEHPSSFLLAAWIGDQPVATLGVTAQPQRLAAHCGELGMGVRKSVWRRGLGRALLGLGMAQAERAGLWNLTLKVRTYNRAAIALYEKAGFRLIGTLQKVAAIDDGFEDEHVYQHLGPRPIE
jgi:RimJ/RimL family protein N-acetyltransferase